jgi:hypothetical protein
MQLTKRKFTTCEKNGAAQIADESDEATDRATRCGVSTQEGISMAGLRENWPAVQQRAREVGAELGE